MLNDAFWGVGVGLPTRLRAVTPRLRGVRAAFALAVLAAGGAQAACPKEAVHFRVGADTTYCTHPNIQAAIDAATCSTIIEITREHLYAGGYCNPNQPSGCHLSISGKNITLQGRADGETCYSLTQCIPGPSCPAPSATSPLVTLDGASNGRVLSISGGSNVNIRNLTITHGDAGGGSGGGIDFNGSGNLNITRSTIANNQAGYGGGISITASAALNLRLQTDTLLLNNTAAVSGGGVRIEGAGRLFATSDRTLLSFNHALSGYGGGIEILGPARADIGSPGYNGAGVVSNNDAVYGAGIAAVDNGNGGAVLRTFADAASRPTEIESNGGAAAGGGIYTAGQADACLLATRVAGNSAEDGAAVYFDSAAGYGVYVNAGWPVRLGADCGPEPVATLGGTTMCSADNADCSAFDDNATKHPDGSPSAGATILGYGAFVARRFHMRGNIARDGIHGGGTPYDLDRCLIADNSFSGSVMELSGSAISLTACTVTHNVIDGNFVLRWDFVNDVHLAFDIIDQPGKYTINWLNYYGNGAFDISYMMSNSLAGLPQNNPSIVTGAPTYVNAAAGDYHLKPVAQKALDFGGSNGSIDLDGNLPYVDLPLANLFGPADLGAYERQSLFACGSNDSIFCDTFDQ